MEATEMAGIIGARKIPLFLTPNPLSKHGEGAIISPSPYLGKGSGDGEGCKRTVSLFAEPHARGEPSSTHHRCFCLTGDTP